MFSTGGARGLDGSNNLCCGFQDLLYRFFIVRAKGAVEDERLSGADHVSLVELDANLLCEDVEPDLQEQQHKGQSEVETTTSMHMGSMLPWCYDVEGRKPVHSLNWFGHQQTSLLSPRR